MEALKGYLFDLVIENFIHDDYVTNKVYQALYAGAIPVYYGSPKIEHVLPCRDCIINVANFRTTAELAEHLIAVAKDIDMQRAYHAWRQVPYKPADFPGFERARELSMDTLHCRWCHAVDPKRCQAHCDETCHATAISNNFVYVKK